MPVSPPVQKALRAVRREIAAPARNDHDVMELYLAIHKLRDKARRIVTDPDNLRAVLDLVPEIEAFRGKGSQVAAEAYTEMLLGLVYRVSESPPDARNGEEAGAEKAGMPEEMVACAGLLAEYAYGRVCGPKLRSDFQARLRAGWWRALGVLSGIIRRPEYPARALEVAGDPRARIDEREGAVLFLGAYWRDRGPDEATAELLHELEKDAPNRRFLVSVMVTQIDLGMNDEFGGMIATDAWDEAHDERPG